MNEKQYELSAAELQVLTALWDVGPATVRDVMNHLHEKGRHVAYTTVMTFLGRLQAKGFVTSDKTALAFVYRPIVTRERVQKSRLKNLVSQLYDGAAGALVLQLVKTERLTPKEVEELQKLIERLDKGSK